MARTRTKEEEIKRNKERRESRTANAPKSTPAPAPPRTNLKPDTSTGPVKRGGLLELEDGRTFIGSSPEETAAVRQREALIRQAVVPQQASTQLTQAGVEQQLGTSELKGQLEGDIAAPPEIAPKSVAELIVGSQGVEGETGKELLQRLLKGGGSVRDIKDAARAITGGAAVGAAVGSGLALLPTIATSAAATAIGAKVGALSLTLGGSASLILAGTVGGGPLDIDRGEISTQQQTVTKMVELGERIEASVRNGYDPTLAIQQLTQMSNAVDEAEASLKANAIFNVKYRTGKEYIKDQQSIIGARTAIQRRIFAIENIAATGGAALNPEELIITAGV